MDEQPPGLHHVTIVSGDMQGAIDFYAWTLGLRLVKRTVNFDDPTAHHCYFGDRVGTPGTLLTVFAWPDHGPAQPGAGRVQTVGFTVPPGSLDWWADHLADRGVETTGPYERFDERVLGFRDPDGLELELVAPASADPATADGRSPHPDPWDGGPVPADRGIESLHGVTVAVATADPTAGFLDELGLREAERGHGRRRLRAAGPWASVVDIVETPNARPGHGGTGSVHHVAVRVPKETTPWAVREALENRGAHVSAVIDRTYFYSVYARDPGGVLFEAATDEPGVTVDESADDLGSGLVLPDWLEADREAIEAELPRLTDPTAG
jgi:glyoxalase family protein